MKGLFNYRAKNKCTVSAYSLLNNHKFRLTTKTIVTVAYFNIYKLC